MPQGKSLLIHLAWPIKDIRDYPLTVFFARNSVASQKSTDVLGVVAQSFRQRLNIVRLSSDVTGELLRADLEVTPPVRFLLCLQSASLDGSTNILSGALKELGNLNNGKIGHVGYPQAQARRTAVLYKAY
jgi:hypothetical protein